ncbi:hypothetical protein HK098_001980 [Nowakowskiella sp. JEL0407]|nr:hypothetical protein HK098_001980 [Nowakowskiella sp. JEL0407]
MGDTSSGKSSVLSALSGIEFPSNHAPTTRCPTQISMRAHSYFEGRAYIQRYQYGKSEEAVVIQDLSEMKGLIAKVTEQLVNEGQQISDDKIVIEVAGPDFPSLTLIDLPGLVRTTVKKDGEDPAIMEQIRGLVKRYLDEDRTIILAIVPGNVNVHNSEILNAAQKVDPTGKRTLAVITKTDLVEKGTETPVVDLLNNEKIILKHRFHAVRCRNQVELDGKVSWEMGLSNEVEFFSNTSPWNLVNPDLVGIPNLRAKLITLLENHVRECLPDVRNDIETGLAEVKKQLELLRPTLPDLKSKRTAYRECCFQIVKLFNDAIRGIYLDSFFQVAEHRVHPHLAEAENEFIDAIKRSSIIKTNINELEKGDSVEFYWPDGKWYKGTYFGGSAGNYTIMLDDGITRSASTVRFAEIISTEQVRMERTDEWPVFTSFRELQSIAQKYISAWRDPATQLLDHYDKRLKFLCDKLLGQTVPQTLNSVRGRMKNVLLKFLERLISAAKEDLEKDLKKERFLYTSNETFHNTFTKLQNDELLQSIVGNAASTTSISVLTITNAFRNVGIGERSCEEMKAHQLKLVLAAYLKIAHTRFADNVIKSLRCTMFDPDILKELQDVLDVADEDLDQIVVEPAGLAQRRQRLIAKRDALEMVAREIQS